MTNLYEWIFISSGIIFFISIIGVLLSDAKSKENLRRIFGLIFIALLIPVTVVFIYYLLFGAAIHIYVSFSLIMAYLLAELLLDFILKIDFRTKASRHIPYILLEYAACFSFIIISFEINEILGWLISGLFWVLLGVLIYYIVLKKRREKQ